VLLGASTRLYCHVNVTRSAGRFKRAVCKGAGEAALELRLNVCSRFMQLDGDDEDEVSLQ
jgi:hypothetical protein